MVGWLYIDGEVAAPIHVLDVDLATGVMGVEIAGKFVPDRADLRREVVIEYYAWKTRRLVRCLGAERIGTLLMIEAVDVGQPITPKQADPARGEAEDWLIVQGEPRCRVSAFSSGAAAGSGRGHCIMHIPRETWRDLRVGKQAPLAAVGAAVGHKVHAGIEAITPKLQPTPLSNTPMPVEVKVVRLRERLVYHLTPLASDWAENSTVVVAKVDGVERIG
ncbi:MAG: hypothetical protein ACIAXF_11080 [Phycisphaerales bacterium JB063]